MIPCSGNKM